MGQEDRNAMQMGEFEVIKELLAAFPEAKVAKAQVDKLIDLAAPPPRGTGVEKLTGVTTLNEIYAAIKEKVPKLEPIRIPMNQEMAPAEENFDQIVAMLKDTTASCPVIFNCQAGISRTTTAIVCGALVKELQLTRELDRMRGIVPD